MSNKKKVRWGFKWPQIVSGLVMLAIGGGFTYAGWLVGVISVWAAVLAMVGAFTLINGLMGEEGVW